MRLRTGMRAALALLVASGLSLGAETRISRVTTGGSTTIIKSELTETKVGSDTQFLLKRDDGTMSGLLDSTGQVKTTEVVSSEGTCRFASDGRKVVVTGTWKGRQLSGTVDLHGLPYYGFGFEFALRALLRSGLQGLHLLMITPDDVGHPVEIALSREGTAPYRGQEGIVVKVEPAGVLSVFWKAHYLMSADGHILRYTGNQGPGTPDMVQELIEIRP